MLLAAASLAQDGPPPPKVSEDAPVLGSEPADTDAALVVPDAWDLSRTGVAPAEPLPTATDLASLVLKAHWVVQAVMAALVLAVAAVLTVFLFKVVEFALAFARLRRAGAQIAVQPGLAAVPGDCPLALTSQALRHEADLIPAILTADLRAAARERVELRLERIEAGAVRRLRSGGGLLASIGAVGPFVGLFGTVFGIMNSFVAIAATKTTSLSVVAPGIAEALLATGIGLVAAIPAVLLFNAMLRQVAAFRHALADARAELLLRFSRELDARMTEGT
ncbi:MAG: MotA/TolQ/ExbB proton channel family protein [Tabrizicola sp.]|uniref:MotA/TolQ/ExbB proton channel family protein n=1 Tax=Tabrizicola sp. TaxID=2005166 RepID=UPI002AB9AD65|nr:MotA/TolQ/ExbB proton channel family protein [Tabrizicola sp.]MDZ4088073.1 MotA/TolQ/ExbB proton channel family protein [Tabrizicola sp.]